MVRLGLLALAPLVGRWMTSHDPRPLALIGFASLAGGLLWLSLLMDPDASVLVLLLPFVLIGIGNACIWGPLSLTATRNLPPSQAGAGSGVYNELRQVGSVLGSAAIAGLGSDQVASFTTAQAAALGDAEHEPDHHQHERLPGKQNGEAVKEETECFHRGPP